MSSTAKAALVYDDTSTEVIPFQLINGLIVIQAELDNELGNYIFDTGAEELILNKEAGSGKTMFSSINGDIATEEVNVNLLKIGNLTHSKIKAFSTDLQSIESYLNISIQGIIGFNLFIPQKVMIDYKAKEITLYSAKEDVKVSKRYVPFKLQDGVLVCNLSIQGKEYLFGFDTGATINVIDESVFHLIADSFIDHNEESYVTTGTGEKTIHKIVNLSTFNLGTASFNDSKFLIQSMEVFNESMDQAIQGVLSLSSLPSEVIIIDVQSKRIYF